MTARAKRKKAKVSERDREKEREETKYTFFGIKTKLQIKQHSSSRKKNNISE